MVALLASNPLKGASVTEQNGENTLPEEKSPQIARVQIVNSHGQCVQRQFLIPNQCHSVLFQMKQSFSSLHVHVFDSMEQMHQSEMEETVVCFSSGSSAHEGPMPMMGNSSWAEHDPGTLGASLNPSFRMHMMGLDMHHRLRPMERIISNCAMGDPERKQTQLNEFYAPLERGFTQTDQEFTRLLRVNRIRVRVAVRNLYTTVKQMMMEGPPKPASPVQYLKWSQERLRLIEIEMQKCECVIEIERDLQVIGMQKEESPLNEIALRYMRQLLSQRLELLLTAIQNRALDHVQGQEMLVAQRREANRRISEWVSKRLPRMKKDLDSVCGWREISKEDSGRR